MNTLSRHSVVGSLHGGAWQAWLFGGSFTAEHVPTGVQLTLICIDEIRYF